MRTFRSVSLLAALGCFLAAPVTALEVLTEEDFIQGTVVEDQLVRLADNAIFLIDTSSSMNDEYLDTGKSKLEVAIAEFKRRNSYFPAIGHKFGIYEYTPWKVIYPLQTFDRDKVAEALEGVSDKGKGPTPLATGVEEAEKVAKQLTGRTVIFLFYDGDYTGRSPDPALWRLIKENDVCLIMISSATDRENERLEGNIDRLNACSRLVPLENFISRPEYTTNALFDVVATEQLVTSTEKRVAGVKVENILFDFDKTELTAADKAELDALGKFMQERPKSYAVLAGYTDNIGIEDYNEYLSQQRTEMVASYLSEKYGIDDSRLVLHWHGSDNPIASNDTDEGRAKNRRVEVAVGGV
jgi:outer membrane protein OmpA-like peptidoglycan-associated protein